MIHDLWKSLKLQREEVEYLKRKRDEEIENEIFNKSEAEFFETKLVKGLDDRLVISVNIRVKGYLQYTLDAQVDIGAMNSCAKHGAIKNNAYDKNQHHNANCRDPLQYSKIHAWKNL